MDRNEDVCAGRGGSLRRGRIQSRWGPLSRLGSTGTGTDCSINITISNVCVSSNVSTSAGGSTAMVRCVESSKEAETVRQGEDLRRGASFQGQQLHVGFHGSLAREHLTRR